MSEDISVFQAGYILKDMSEYIFPKYSVPKYIPFRIFEVYISEQYLRRLGHF